MKVSRSFVFTGLTLALLILPTLAAAQNSIKCESNNGRRNYCGDYYSGQVRMERQISGSPCIQGQTWGVDRQGLWVDRGCRAYFTISSYGNRGGRHGDRDDRDNRGSGYNQQSIKCESNDGRRNYCGNYNPGQVRFDRQISGSACIEGRTWGVDRQGLWVDRGCRAYFTVRGGGYGSGGYNGGGNNNGGWWNPEPGDTWPPRGTWHGGNWNSGGACFYRERNYGGSFFCLRRGEQRDSLGGYGDAISSVRTFGGARVTLYDDRNFSGARESLGRDVYDLHQLSVQQKPGHTWNDRVSSVQVR
jgi:hypothetical protein